MFQKNCRVNPLNGFTFYEKDILYDDYVFTHNIEINTNITYITPGFGIALIDCESCSIKDKPDAYLFKIGYKEASIYFSSAGNGLQLVKQISCPDAITIQENLNFKLSKKGRKVSIYLNNKLILEEVIKKSLDKYNIGYYSNIKNTIHNISIKANIPNNWTINMKNTNGGYIRFIDNGFEIIDCEFNAEIEQAKIKLKPGTYYINAKTCSINNKNDLKYYIYKSDDDRYIDDKKNILRNNSFTLFEETEINLKITGTNGKISELIISTEIDSDYIPTNINYVDFDGSYIDILLDKLDKIEWEGVIFKTPFTKIDKDKIKYGLILDNSTTIKPEDINIKLSKKYSYEFNAKSFMFYIKDENEIVYSTRLTNISNKITIFKNLSATISKLTLYKKDKEIIDIVSQKQDISFINANISSPIIVLDNYNLPLDLSSSYRACKINDNVKYIFTNWEREYFTPQKTLKLEKNIIDKEDSLIVYGIKKNGKYNLKDIYNVYEDNINSIDLFTKDYDLLKLNDLMFVDKKKSLIYLKNDQLEKYEMFIIDYLKNDSYCINFNYEKNNYEIDISSLSDTKILYDSVVIDENEDKIITQINNYKLTNINGNINGYIVLSQGGI